MHEQTTTRRQRLAREKAVYRYITALEQGDIDTIAALLQQAERDPMLEQMILEAQDVYSREDQNAPQPGQIAVVRYKLLNLLSEQEETGILSSRPPARVRRRRILIQSAVAVIVVCALIGSALLLFAPRQPHTGSRSPALGNWKLVSAPNPGSAQNNLQGVAADAANDAWAVGSFSNSPYPDQSQTTLIEHWNGFAWSAIKGHNAQLENSGLSGVVALSPNNVWVVGNTFRHNSSQTLIEHWNGSAWSIVNGPTPVNSSLYDVAAISADDIWAVGGYGNNNTQRTLIEHWDGRSWKVVQAPSVGSGFNFLTHIAAISANDVWAVGFYAGGQAMLNNQAALIEHWNGTAWSIVSNPAPDNSSLYGIAAVSADDIWAVGSLSTNSVGEPLLEHWNGSSWSIAASPGSTLEGISLNAVAARSTDDVWVIGSTEGSQPQTLIEHWDGHAWKTVNSPNIGTNGPDAPTFNNQLNSIAVVPSSHALWAVGDAENTNVTVSPAATPTQFSPVNSQIIIASYGL